MTDFRRAVKAKDDEAIVFSWLEYPSKAERDAANAKMHADTSAKDMAMPFDGTRMIFGGFDCISEQRGSGAKAGYVEGVLVPVENGAWTWTGSESREFQTIPVRPVDGARVRLEE